MQVASGVHLVAALGESSEQAAQSSSPAGAMLPWAVSCHSEPPARARDERSSRTRTSTGEGKDEAARLALCEALGELEEDTSSLAAPEGSEVFDGCADAPLESLGLASRSARADIAQPALALSALALSTLDIAGGRSRLTAESFEARGSCSEPMSCGSVA